METETRDISYKKTLTHEYPPLKCPKKNKTTCIFHKFDPNIPYQFFLITYQYRTLVMSANNIRKRAKYALKYEFRNNLAIELLSDVICPISFKI